MGYGIGEQADLEELVEKCMRPRPWSGEYSSKLRTLFERFTQRRRLHEEPKRENKSLVQRVNGATDDIAYKISDYLKVREIKQATGYNEFRETVPFALADFLVSAVLQSVLTATEKLELLYDLYALHSREGSPLTIASVKVMLKALLDRNLSHLTTSQAFALVDMLFDPVGNEEPSLVGNRNKENA